MRQVAVVAVPPATTFDLSIPELVLGETIIDGRPGYQVRICTAHPGRVATSSMEVTVPLGLEAVDDADTVIVTGTGARDDIEPSFSRRCATRQRRANASPRSAQERSSSPKPGCSTAAAPPPTGPSPRSSPPASPRSSCGQMCFTSRTATS
jgi:hypothetical protein